MSQRTMPEFFTPATPLYEQFPDQDGIVTSGIASINAGLAVLEAGRHASPTIAEGLDRFCSRLDPQYGAYKNEISARAFGLRGEWRFMTTIPVVPNMQDTGARLVTEVTVDHSVPLEKQPRALRDAIHVLESDTAERALEDESYVPLAVGSASLFDIAGSPTQLVEQGFTYTSNEQLYRLRQGVGNALLADRGRVQVLSRLMLTFGKHHVNLGGSALSIAYPPVDPRQQKMPAEKLLASFMVTDALLQHPDTNEVPYFV